jgi:hypothetical protein
MRKGSRLLVVLVMIFSWIGFFASAAHGETFDILSYAAPAQWARTVVEKNHVLFTRYNESRSAFCQIYVYSSIASAGDPQKDFEYEWDFLIRRNFKAEYEGEPKKTESGTGWTAVMGIARFPVKGHELQAALISITGAGRVACVLVTSTDISQFSDEVDAFTNSVVPVEQAAAAAPANQPPAAAEKPSQPSAAPAAPGSGAKALFGMWTGVGTTSTTTGITNAAGTGYSTIYRGSRIKVTRIAFFPDGTMCGSIPQAGFDGLDLKAQREGSPDYWGTYTFANGKGNVTIKGLSYPFELKDGKLFYDRVEFDEHYQSLDNARFAGTFTALKNPTGYSGREPTLTFALDGTFADTGAVNWMLKGSVDDGSGKAVNSGRYLIRNFTMIFDYDDGRQIRMAFESIYGKDPKNPQQIVFTAMPLDRK